MRTNKSGMLMAALTASLAMTATPSPAMVEPAAYSRRGSGGAKCDGGGHTKRKTKRSAQSKARKKNRRKKK